MKIIGVKVKSVTLEQRKSIKELCDTLPNIKECLLYTYPVGAHLYEEHPESGYHPNMQFYDGIVDAVASTYEREWLSLEDFITELKNYKKKKYKMKIKVNFRYWENEIPKHCRIPRMVEHTAVTVVTVKEYTNKDVPIAIKYHKTCWDKDGNEYLDVLNYRWVNNNLYLPSEATYAGLPDVPTTLLPEYILGENRFADGRGYYKHANPYGYSGHYGENKDTVKNIIRKHFAEYILIDNKVYCTVGEPRYCVMTFGMGMNHGGTSVMVDNRYNSNISKDRYFSVLQRKEALAEGKRTALARGDNKSVPFHTDKIKVLIPEAIKVNPNKQHGDGNPFINKLNSLFEAKLPNGITALLAVGMAYAQ